MAETGSIAEVKAHLSELVALAGAEAMEETIAVLPDPALLESLPEADAALARGEGESPEGLAEAMRTRRATVAVTRIGSGSDSVSRWPVATVCGGAPIG